MPVGVRFHSNRMLIIEKHSSGCMLGLTRASRRASWVHASWPAHEMAVAASAPHARVPATPQEMRLPTPSAAVPVPNAWPCVCWVQAPCSAAIIEAATALAVPSSPLIAEPPAPRLQEATPASASVIKSAPAASAISGAAITVLEALRTVESIWMATCAVAIRRVLIIVDWR